MDHLQRSLLNYFSLQPLDRTAHLRIDKAWLASRSEHPGSLFFLLHNEAVIVQNEQPVILNYERLANAQLLGAKRYYLGTQNQQSFFAVNISDISELNLFPDQTTLNSLRDLADGLDMETASILAYAQLMNYWHLTTQHCRICGSHLESNHGGHILECISTNCKHIEFPRINPAVIMRVCCDDKILLARQQTWPKNRYSVLAGFVEPGETLEQAVRREVMEEAGIEVDTIHYHSSQPWPFPNSLMIGYCAQTKQMNLDIENDDLETALWLDADELTHHMSDRSVILSPSISISHRLIEDWFMEKTGHSIKDWQDVKPVHIIHENE